MGLQFLTISFVISASQNKVNDKVTQFYSHVNKHRRPIIAKNERNV